MSQVLSLADPLLVLLPLLIILSTFLFLLLTFLVCVIIVRRRRGIILRDNDGPIDMSREDLIDGDGGFENLEFRWLEEADDSMRRNYLRAKGSCALHSCAFLDVHIFCRIPTAIPSKLTANRYYPIPVSLDTRKGGFGLVV